MRIPLLIFAALLVVVAVFIGLGGSGDEVDPRESDRAESGRRAERAAPRSGAVESKKLSKRVREGGRKQSPRSLGWKLVEHMKQTHQDPDTLVFTDMDLVREEPILQWQVRAVANDEGVKRLQTLTSGRGAVDFVNTVFDEIGDEAFSEKNRPRLQFTSFRVEPRRSDDSGRVADGTADLPKGIEFTFRVYFPRSATRQ